MALRPRLNPALPLTQIAGALVALLASGLVGAVSAEPGVDPYLAAERVLKSGDRGAFESLVSGLRGHPLYPYLRYRVLAEDLQAVSDAEIEAFLAEFAETPPAERLRSAYVTRLAAQARWGDYVRIYRPDDSVERRCLFLRALIETGDGARALAPAEMEPLWLAARSQPAVCDPVFTAWKAAGGLTEPLVWARIRLAMEAGELRLARYLGGQLSEGERPWLERWLRVHSRPEVVLDPVAMTGADHPLAAAILAHGIARLARTSPGQASEALSALQGQLMRDPAASDRAHHAVARYLFGSDAAGAPGRALAVWDRMSARPENLSAQEERLRAAVRLGDWGRVADWIGRMPAGEEKADRWLYWQGRAQSALGLEAEAGTSFAEAASRRSLWGFLAADRLGLPYPLDHRPVPADPEQLGRLTGGPALARILELRRLGRQVDMRREWRTLTRGLDDRGLMAAALLADLLGWHDQAIFTLARTGYWDDLALRFPLRYRELVAEQAWQTGLGEDWIFAVLRQESVFAPDIASGAGALGLMQLMPATAREVARTLGPKGGDPSRSQILDPELNITLGSTYLAWLRDRFGHVALATAAYNAGPHRVARWLPDDCMEADRWILGIPFQETRGYVERVLAYRVIYGARLGLEPQRISDWLAPVPGRSSDGRVTSGEN